MELIQLPKPPDVMKILRGERFCEKLPEIVAITERGLEAGMLISTALNVGIYTGEYFLGEVEKGTEGNAPKLKIPPGHLLVMELHSHTDCRGYVTPSSEDLRLSVVEPTENLENALAIGLTSQKALDYCRLIKKGVQVERPSDEEWEVDAELARKVRLNLDGLNKSDSWQSYQGVVGIVNGIAGLVMYESPRPGERTVQMISQFTPNRGRGNFKAQGEVIEALRIACPFADYVAFSKSRRSYHPI